ncbi:PAS domain-containing protein [bacterium]|nr:PAS domain-containing protein [bacterium]
MSESRKTRAQLLSELAKVRQRADKLEAREAVRRQAVQALREGEKRLAEFREIVTGSQAVVFRWRVAEGWPVEFVSNNVVDVLGYTAEDFTSGRVSWPGITHPDDVPRLETEVASYLREGIMEFSQEYRLLTRSGDVRWIEDRNMALVDQKGRITHVQGIVLDVTQRRQREREILDHSTRERQQLGEHIHETLAQDLVAILLLIRSLEEDLSGKVMGRSQATMEISTLVRESLNQVLRIARSLSLVRAEADGLAAGLRQIAASVWQLFGISCRCLIKKPVLVADSTVSMQLYHIAQAAVDYALRTARPKGIAVELQTGQTRGHLTVSYDSRSEEGDGDDIELRVMRYRAEMIGGSVQQKRGRRGKTVLTCSFDPRGHACTVPLRPPPALRKQ